VPRRSASAREELNADVRAIDVDGLDADVAQSGSTVFHRDGLVGQEFDEFGHRIETASRVLRSTES
jgi:hypothetical protein